MGCHIFRLIATAGAALLLVLPLHGPLHAKDRWGGGVNADSLLPVDEAFQLQPLSGQGSKLRVEWQVAPGYYLYLDRLEFTPLDPATAKLKPAQLPAGEKVHDAHFGDTRIQRSGRLTATLRTHPPVRQLQVRYQGCAEIGVCYPPQTRILSLPPP